MAGSVVRLDLHARNRADGPGFAHTQLDAVRGSDAQPAIGVNVRPSVVDDRMRYDAIVASFA